MPSGVYRRVKGVNVNNENHPWRKAILSDVIEAKIKRLKKRANWVKSNLHKK